MTRKEVHRCTECGNGMILMNAKAGRFSPWRNMPSVPIPSDFEIPSCNNCGAEWLDEDTAEALDRVLGVEYRRILRERVRHAIDVLTPHISQRRLESLLGISQGYLSRLRSGEKDPSPELVSNLALLARDPIPRLAELKLFWEGKQSSIS